MNKFSNSLGPTSVRTNNLRQLIRKCPALTLAVQTSPTARLHLHHHGGALSRQVLKVSEISAVPTCRRLAAPRTGAYFRSDCRDHPTIAVPLDRKIRAPGPGAMFFRILAYRPDAQSNQPARKVRQTPFHGFFGGKFDNLKPRWPPTVRIDVSTPESAPHSRQAVAQWSRGSSAADENDQRPASPAARPHARPPHRGQHDRG